MKLRAVAVLTIVLQSAQAATGPVSLALGKLLVLPETPEGGANDTGSAVDQGPPDADGQDDKAVIDQLWHQLQDEEHGRRSAEEAARSLQSKLAESQQEHDDLAAQLAQSMPQLGSLEWQIETLKRKDKAISDILDPATTGPLVDDISDGSKQHTLAVIAGVLGTLGLLGPTTFVWAFQALVGSAALSLLIASSAAFFTKEIEGSGANWLVVTWSIISGSCLGGANWLVVTWSLVSGSGDNVTYIIVAVAAVLSMYRWREKIFCMLWGKIDTMHLVAPGAAAAAVAAAEHPRSRRPQDAGGYVVPTGR